jgi:hypothetical protein
MFMDQQNNIVKMAIISKAIYKCNAVPIKIPLSFFTEMEKPILKFIWKHKRPQIAKAIKKSNNIDLKSYCRAIGTKPAWCRHKNRHMGQWNRIEDPEIKPHSFSHRDFDIGAKTIHWKKDNLFNQWYWKFCIVTCRGLKLDTLSAL